MSSSPIRSELVARAEDLIPNLRERRQHGHGPRRLLDEIIKEIREAGLFKVLQRGGWGATRRTSAPTSTWSRLWRAAALRRPGC